MKRIAYIAAIFPKRSETFLQREAKTLLKKGYTLDIYSLWGGEDHWEGQKIRRIKKWEILKLAYLFPYYILVKPKVFIEIFEAMLNRPLTSCVWLGENLWGIASALLLNAEIKKSKPDHLHGVWAALPACTAWILSKLNDKPFSFGAHAYDVFQFDGDWLLKDKAKEASFLQTSSLATRQRLLELGIDSEKILFHRRGMLEFPNFINKEIRKTTIQLISVGRLVAKKDYPFLLKVAQQLHLRKIDFQLEIIGSGPLEKTLKKQIQLLNLNNFIQLSGAKENSIVLNKIQQSDLFLFTGKIAEDGDRDGLPNVVPEAMACGTPTIVSTVGALPEVIKDQVNGILIKEKDPFIWADKIEELIRETEQYKSIAQNARSWVLENFNNDKNTEKLIHKIETL